MLSPMMTVFVLAVLWLIVVVPMIFRRHDERSRERSVDGFGRSMRALGRRAHPADARTEVFVASARSAQPSVATRRPVPVAQEALMYPVDRNEMSEARVAMMARRRRSLGTLGAGAIVLIPTALMIGGIMWLPAAPFGLGLLGYLWFLRSQAQRDRDRRYNRQQRASSRRVRGADATAERGYVPAPAPVLAAPAESMVRIDDDDIELHNLDTIDLTGLYNEGLAEAAAQRRAS
ncbi:MAG: divisome protein SepX/GlpR [Jatrophihabitantaceae bacterium]